MCKKFEQWTLIILTAAAPGIFTRCVSPPPEFSENEWYERTRSTDIALLYAPHATDKGTFFNPWLERERRKGSYSFFNRRASRKRFEGFPAERYTHRANDYTYLSNPGFDSISFAGHASMIIKLDGDTVFTDPFFSNAALVVKKEVKIKFDFSQVPRRPVVLISHNHYDHLDKYSVKELIQKDAVFIGPLGLKKFFTDLGAKEAYELDWWESVTIGALSYTLLPAQHWSRRIGQAGGAVLWGSYLISGSKTIYFSGDTGYFRGFEEFGRLYDIDYALLGAGAYEPRWFMHYSHMNITEFFRAADDLQAKVAIPMHFGVISLSDEPVLYPLYEVEEYIKQRPEYAERIRALRVGEFLEIQSNPGNR